MKVAIEYSGHLRFIQDTYPLIKQFFISNENIEFYIFIHTWDESMKEDIDYMINTIKPHRFIIDKQKHFERHPYTYINSNITQDEYKNDIGRLQENAMHEKTNPEYVKHFFEVPSPNNNYKFDKDLEVTRAYTYSHYPHNTLSLFYSIHQVHVLAMSYKHEHNITFDFVIRMRSDMIMSTINLSHVNKDAITVFDAAFHKGEFGKYTIHDQMAIGNEQNMTTYTDLFVYLPVYYFIFKLDWISEILLGFHLQYNNIAIQKIPRLYELLRYPDRLTRSVGRPTR